VVQPVLVRGNHVVVPWKQDGPLGSNVLTQPDIVVVKVWSVHGADGVLAWTNKLSRSSSGKAVPNHDRGKIDHRFPLDDELGEAVHENQPVAALVGTGADGEDAFERNDLGFRHLFEVYAPIDDKKHRVIGAYEIYADPRGLG